MSDRTSRLRDLDVVGHLDARQRLDDAHAHPFIPHQDVAIPSTSTVS